MWRPFVGVRPTRQARVGSKTVRRRCSLSLTLTLSASLPLSPHQSKTEHRRHCRRPPPSSLATAAAPFFDSLRTQLHHTSLHLTDPLASPFKPSLGIAAVQVCHHRALAGAPLSLRSPWPCCTKTSRSCVRLVRVWLDLGLTQGKSLSPMLASSEQNAVMPPRTRRSFTTTPPKLQLNPRSSLRH